jgi:hypothetical protein
MLAMVDLSSDFAARLLFDTPPQVPKPLPVLEALNRRLALRGERLHQAQSSIPGAQLYSGRDLHLLVAVAEAPLAQRSFAAALAAPLARVSPVDLGARVAAHRGALSVSVGDGPFPKTEELIALEARLGVLEEIRPAELGLKISALHAAAAALAEVSDEPPLAVHWGPTDLIAAPDEFGALAEGGFPAALAFRPVFAPGAAAGTGAACPGFVAEGAEALLGVALAVEPAPLGLRQAVGLTAELVARHLAGTLDLTAAGEAKLSQGAHAQWRPAEPDGGFPAGRVAVTLSRAAAPAAFADPEDIDLPLAPRPVAPARPVPRRLAVSAARPAEPPAAAAAAPQPAPEASSEALAEAPAEADADAVPEEAPEPPATTAAGNALVPPDGASPATLSPFTALRAAARVRDRIGAPAGNGALPLAAPEGAAGTVPAPPAVRPATTPRPSPDAAPGTAQAPAEAPPRARAGAAAATERLRALGLDRLYNPDPGEGMLGHVAIALGVALIEPLPGFLLLIATLIRGPLPKLTFFCALIAVAGLGLRLASHLSLFG